MDKGLDDTDLDNSDDSVFIPKRTLTPPPLTQLVSSKKRQERHDPLSPDQRVYIKTRRLKRLRKKSI
jgi:hypothetical protein